MPPQYLKRGGDTDKSREAPPRPPSPQVLQLYLVDLWISGAWRLNLVLLLWLITLPNPNHTDTIFIFLDSA